jgi:multidrug efflux pump subunit AcrA (membrane-fusion protein)
VEYDGSETQTEIQRQLLKLSLEEAQARYKQAAADVSEKEKSHLADIAILKYTLLRHTRHRDRHVRDVEVFTLRAPIDGLVVMQQLYRGGGEMAQVQQGDRLSPGQPFMKIVDTSKMQVEANVNQAETSSFRVGQKAKVKLDAFPGLEFEGRIHSIGALAAGGWRNSYYVRTVPVRVSIIGNHPKLIPDLSASCDVVVASIPDATSVPLAAVQSENGKDVVYVKNGANFDRREVTTGFRSATHVAILSGVQSGQHVRLN